MYATTNPDVFNLTRVDEATNLSLFHAHALGELPWRLQSYFVSDHFSRRSPETSEPSVWIVLKLTLLI